MTTWQPTNISATEKHSRKSERISCWTCVWNIVKNETKQNHWLRSEVELFLLSILLNLRLKITVLSQQWNTYWLTNHEDFFKHLFQLTSTKTLKKEMIKKIMTKIFLILLLLSCFVLIFLYLWTSSSISFKERYIRPGEFYLRFL